MTWPEKISYESQLAHSSRQGSVDDGQSPELPGSQLEMGLSLTAWKPQRPASGSD